MSGKTYDYLIVGGGLFGGVWAYLARRQGKTVMRPDTWEHNTPANRMYPALGYRLAGAAEFFFMDCVHEVLDCYEKLCPPSGQ